MQQNVSQDAGTIVAKKNIFPCENFILMILRINVKIWREGYALSKSVSNFLNNFGEKSHIVYDQISAYDWRNTAECQKTDTDIVKNSVW